MAKRQLSDRQKRRLEKKQAKALDDEGTPRSTNKPAPNPSESSSAKATNENTNDIIKETFNGLVITNFGRQVLIEDESNPGSLNLCHLRANIGVTVTGDRVAWQKGDAERDENGVVLSIYPRKTELQRPDGYGKLRPVAANVTQMLITIAIEPEPHKHLIDRYLVAAENHDVCPVLLINKSDLIDASNTQTIEEIRTLYSTLGYQVVDMSASDLSGLEKLKDILKNNTSIFVGQSGVGKSSLIKSLLPDTDIKIGALSEQMGKGKHTTTHSCLYHFPWGGDCIDSPGIREFGMWHFDADQVMRGFIDLNQYSGQCHFRDCTHVHEPNCAIQEAVENGKILPGRFESFRRIVNQLDDVEIKTNL